MSDNQKAAVLGAFVADALSLGAHWVYNTGVIDKKLGRVERYYDPMTSYHKGKKAGDFTHYGDQTLVLLESVSGHGEFDALRFARMWRAFWDGYDGYVDKATRATLNNMDAGRGLLESGSDSDDLAGASRLAALLVACRGDPERLARAAREQAAVTHNHPLVLLCAEFFARCVAAVLQGNPPAASVTDTLETHFSDSAIASLIVMGLESRGRDTRETIAEFGQMCSVEAGIPSSIHLIIRYGDRFKTALVENVMAGGDSSARGMLTGMILGAAHGMSAIPESWRSELTAGARIASLLDQG
ncbi:MAG: ADP-ribosylglycohydrolase family protein [Desulfosarcina sp.]